MRRHNQHLNIPIEIVRTVVAISETGSLSKAAERLGLSQPAISSQVKRLQTLVGGSLFVKTASGTTTTELGKLALQHARRIIEANDQLLRLGGNNIGSLPLRLGLGSMFVEEFMEHHTAEKLADVYIQTDQSTNIGRGLIEGYIDIACIFKSQQLEADIGPMVVNEHEEPFVWVRARNFVLSPGAPIPILAFPGDDWMIPTLGKHGLSYKIVFSSPDNHARLSAARAGAGLTAVPDRMVPPDLVRAKEYYLPALPPIKLLLCARIGLEIERASNLMKQLSNLFFESKGSRAGAEEKPAST
jgi:DNA-binding transcriptional LysR family regulator